MTMDITLIPAMDDILAELGKGTKCVLLHSNADPDALGSAAALKLAFSDVSIGSVEGLSKTGKCLERNLELDVLDRPDITLFDRIIVVDAPSPDRLGEYRDRLKDPMVIDHHRPSYDWYTPFVLVDETRSSTSEVIHTLLKHGGRKISMSMGLALLAGIITDTGKFSHANAATFRTVGEIMEETGISMNDVLSVFEVEFETDYSKKISRLKGAQRLRYLKVGDFIVAYSQVGAFESSLCQGLINLGADIAFVGSQKGNNFRISARATQAATSSGLHLGDILHEIGEENGCNGGGHDGAAGMSGVGDVEALLNICVERLNLPKNTGKLG
jgi:nanoRNase/pAp phosphatase (c-di-AMP/oligoRNAs hydrolase)